MDLSVFAVVLCAAALHASWNAIVKGRGDTLMTTVLVAAFAALPSLLLLPVLPAPAMASWPFIAASASLQVGYFVLVARAYHVADMSFAYPLMRGTAPVLVALAGLAGLGQGLPAAGWAGIGILCAGILSMVAQSRQRTPAGLRVALSNAAVIAGYTLIDGFGVRRSGSAAAYGLWLFLLTGAVLVGWALLRRRDDFRRHALANWRYGLLGGFGTAGSYGLALWAMTVAPIAMVAALRETSILFGTAISALILRERVGRVRIAAACIILAGAMVLRLA